MSDGETAICVVDRQGNVGDEVVTDPDAIKETLRPYLRRPRLLGHEAGALSPWLHPELLRLGLPAVCPETRHVLVTARMSRAKAANGCGYC